MEYLLTNFFLIVLYSIIITFFVGISHSNARVRNRIFLIVCLLQLLFFYTFTSYFSDLVPYGITFYDLGGVSLFKAFSDDLELAAGSIEPGYRFFMWLIANTIGSYRFFLALNGFFILFCYFKTISQYSPYVIVSVLLFLLIVFDSSLYILRQNLSLAILLLSYPYIIKRDIKKYLIIVFFAYLLHNSALIFLPTYFIYSIKKLKKYVIISLLGTFVLTVSVKVLMLILADYLQRYAKYTDETNQYYGIMNWTYAGIFSAVLFVYVFALKKQVFSEGIKKLILSLLVIGTGGAVACSGSSVPNRTFLCYYVAAIISIPISLSYIKTKLIRYLVFLVSISLYFYISYVSEIAAVKNYYFDFSTK